MTYEIKSGVPPKPYHDTPPFEALKINQYFTVSSDRRLSVSAGCHYWGKKLGRRFGTRKQTDGTIQVWRLA